MYFHADFIRMDNCNLFSALLTLCLFICHVPLSEQRALHSTSQIFTFTNAQSFVRVEPKHWSLPHQREISFKFRTDRPHGLLLYHGLRKMLSGDAPLYEFYLTLEKGQIKVIHIYSKDGSQETFNIGKGLNRNKWHHVTLKVQPETGSLTVKVDDNILTATIATLQQRPYYGMKDFTPSSFLYFGGTDPSNPIWFHQYNYVRFVGCLGDIRFSESGGTLEPEDIHSSGSVQEGCLDLCDWNDLCMHGGRCVNHYTYVSCDCFGTKHEEHHCERDNVTQVTLRGYSHITYKIYDWKDRVHSDVNRISLQFKTQFGNGVLFYGAGDYSRTNFMSALIVNGKLEFEIDFGEEVLLFEFEDEVNHDLWHNFTVNHHGKNVQVILDKKSKVQSIQGNQHHLHLDPELYIGAAPDNSKGIKTHQKFIGCIKSFYFNDQSVLLALHKDEPRINHHGIFPPEFGCSDVTVVPMSFPSPHSTLKIDVPSPTDFEISFEFKTLKSDSSLAHGSIKTEYGTGLWQIQLKKGVIFFSVVPDSGQSWFINAGKELNNDQWHSVNVTYLTGKFELTVDYRIKASETYASPLEFQSPFYIGSGKANDVISQGFVGCIREVEIQKKHQDGRALVANNPNSKVTLDNCQLVDPCQNPLACEHGGKCSYVNDQVHCDCEGTGYTGKSCHFSLYKRTCEDLYLVGYRKSGVYKIDIDRNGPLPPAHVYCEMEREDNTIITQVVNNVPPEMVIRKRGMKDFYFDVTYREFNSDMLQSLIGHSHRCYQTIKYECKRASLKLQTYTWMKSSFSNNYVAKLGSTRDGRCSCGDNKTCANTSLFCNCDIMDEMWRNDEANLTDPKELGIMRVYVMQPPYMNPESEGRMTIGPLKCIETNTQQYVITFKTTESYLEVPGWHNGDLAFSFRTSNSHTVLIYQAALHPGHGYFKVILEDDYHLKFEYTINGINTSVILTSPNKLNSGEWQQVWVDHDFHHMRFTVNLQEKMVDLSSTQEIGPFEGPLYVGGVPRSYMKNGEGGGFIGCFRGLVTNDEVVDLFKYVPKNNLVIVTGCQPSCSPNPCKNGATCQEYWGSYICKCKNPVAHSGKNCENNINVNAMTFVTSKSYYTKMTQGEELQDILTEDILLNFRTYVKDALLLYAFDHLNNFVQLHIEKGTRVVFTFNSVRTIVQEGVEVPLGISNGHPVQIHVDREKQKTVLVVNDVKVVINHPINLVNTYEQRPWREGQEKELILPARASLPTPPRRELFLGGVDGLGTTSKLPGFVGCLQGLRIGERDFDLQGEAANMTSQEGAVRPGCKMLCDLHPCHHGGLCIEDWINNKTSCDCSLTSYRGDICQRDIGGTFDGRSQAKHAFTVEGSTKFISVHLSFSTSARTSVSRALLLLTYDKGSRYLMTAITPQGGFFLEEYTGSSAGTNFITTYAILKGGSSLVDGYRHWFMYSHKQNEKPHLIIDGITYKLDEKTDEPFIANSNEDFISIGSAGTNSRFGDYANFIGCISNVFVKLDDKTMEPFEQAYGYKGSPSDVKMDEGVKEDRCADFAFPSTSETHVTIRPPEVRAPEWTSNDPEMISYEPKFHRSQAAILREHSHGTARVAAILCAIMFVVLVGVGIYIWRIQKSHKRQKLLEEVKFFPGNRNSSTRSKQGNSKGVTFSTNNSYMEMKNSDYTPESHPLQDAPLLGDARKNSYSSKQEAVNDDPAVKGEDEGDAPETMPLRSSQSQELEWDPAADNQQLISTAMNEMDTDEEQPDEQEELNKVTPETKEDGITRPLAPLASASELLLDASLPVKSTNNRPPLPRKVPPPVPPKTYRYI